MPKTRKHVEPTPKQGTEWLLQGDTLLGGIRILEFQVQHHEEKIRREQL